MPLSVDAKLDLRIINHFLSSMSQFSNSYVVNALRSLSSTCKYISQVCMSENTNILRAIIHNFLLSLPNALGKILEQWGKLKKITP